MRIRQILSSFNQFDSPTRCNCSIKCRRNIITLTELPQPNKKVAYEFAYFQVKLRSKLHFKKKHAKTQRFSFNLIIH